MIKWIKIIIHDFYFCKNSEFRVNSNNNSIHREKNIMICMNLVTGADSIKTRVSIVNRVYLNLKLLYRTKHE